MTWSPFLSDLTPGPTSTTTPAPSCPRMLGNKPSGSEPESVYLSVWQSPVALISTSTSPALGPASCTVSTTRGLPASTAIAARTSIGVLLENDAAGQKLLRPSWCESQGKSRPRFAISPDSNAAENYDSGGGALPLCPRESSRCTRAPHDTPARAEFRAHPCEQVLTSGSGLAL